MGSHSFVCCSHQICDDAFFKQALHVLIGKAQINPTIESLTCWWCKLFWQFYYQRNWILQDWQTIYTVFSFNIICRHLSRMTKLRKVNNTFYCILTNLVFHHLKPWRPFKYMGEAELRRGLINSNTVLNMTWFSKDTFFAFWFYPNFHMASFYPMTK